MKIGAGGNEEIARKIRQLRDLRGEAQKAFGEKLGVTLGKAVSPQRVNA